ncbi:MAG: DNA repair protein RecO [Bacteroidales bacterium]|jgi:DNA repair protein RecO (recombination protein O)|nr:DNA repair protein RecO [Bacteroidales bacterium]
MIYTTKALILHVLEHTNKKNIVSMYTEHSGYQSFINFEGRQKFHPMSLMEIVAQHKEKAGLGYIKESRLLVHVNQAQFDMRKSAICLFINEILYKILHNKAEDATLFDFLYNSLFFFCKEPYLADFHIRFLTSLMRHLGVQPVDNYSTVNNFFNPELSHFEPSITLSSQEQTIYQCFHQILSEEEYFCSHKRKPILQQPIRNLLLEKILQYYTCHICDMSKIQSYEILKAVCA